MSSLREREVERYYQPWLVAHGSPANVQSKFQIDTQERGAQPRMGRDKIITALAELVALRLGVRCCTVSLIASSDQYVLAKSTGSPSATQGRGESSSELWLRSPVVSRAEAICEHCFTNTCFAREEDGRIYNTKGLIVNDFRLDERFKNRPYVVQEPGVRFYAGVPLCSRSGYNVGAIAVFDDTPRTGLLADQLRLLQEMAENVMKHLEWASDRNERFIGERIVRGMATFIENCSTFHDRSAWENPHESENVSAPSRPDLGRAPPPRPPSRPRYLSRQPARRVKDRREAEHEINGHSHVFAIAAEILLDSTLADGCVIFGATAGSSRPTRVQSTPRDLDEVAETTMENVVRHSSPESETGEPDTGTSDSDSYVAARFCKLLALAFDKEQGQVVTTPGLALPLVTLKTYYAMYPRGKTFSFTEEDMGCTSEEENDAVRGSEEAGVSPAPTTAASTATARSHVRRRGLREFLKQFPDAISITFLPLFNHAEETLVGGAFLWTSAAVRVLLDSDLAYLGTFGNCIVNEVIRVNAQKSEAAKTIFIASMSHELRSPLHGILGAAEFLMDTANDSYESGLVTSIITCGRTLLDTLNHVLDYSKINEPGRTQTRRRPEISKADNLPSGPILESQNLHADIDLGILVEEVTEAVLAGHTFQHSSKTVSLAEVERVDHDSGSPGTKPGHVTVLLDISPGRSWRVRTQPGALRRIIMNLLGNSLKYTSAGFVAISLRAQEATENSTTKAVIRVVDSGKGMSKAYQRNRMFLPFNQEDPFQAGTGLGLSIVKQIVDTLGGEIEVKSELGVGTEVDVHLNLSSVTSDNSPMPTRRKSPFQNFDPKDSYDDMPIFDLEMIAIEKRTRGRHLVLLDPTSPSYTRSPACPTARFQQILRETCTSWFGMTVSVSTDMDVDHADFYVYCEPPPIELLREQNRRADRRAAKGEIRRDQRGVPIIIVCMNDRDAVSMTRHQQSVLRDLGRIVEVIPQPCGPRKLSKVFHHCLRRAEETWNETSQSGRSFLRFSTTRGGAEGEQKHNLAERDKGTRATQQANREGPHDMDDVRQSVSDAVTYPVSTSSSAGTLQHSVDKPGWQPQRSANDDDPTWKHDGTYATLPMDYQNLIPHVLLVDDNLINMKLLVMFMNKCNFTYCEAGNGLEALEKYRNSPTRTRVADTADSHYSSSDRGHHFPNSDNDTHTTLVSIHKEGCSFLNTDVPSTPKPRSRPPPFDFILMDITMPIMDGMEATRHIREHEKDQKLRKCTIIALTGLASDEAREEAEAVGIDVFLPKPVNFKELRALLGMQSRSKVKASMA